MAQPNKGGSVVGLDGQLPVAQHSTALVPFTDSNSRSSNCSTVSIAFDGQQRRMVLEHAVRAFVQLAAEGYAVSAEVLDQPKPCDFLIYVTYTSTPRLVNFCQTAFDDFRMACHTENAVVLVVHRDKGGQAGAQHTALCDLIKSSGVRLGSATEQPCQLHAVVHGKLDASPALVSSSVNTTNQQHLRSLLQSTLQLEALAWSMWPPILAVLASSVWGCVVFCNTRFCNTRSQHSSACKGSRP